MATINSSSSTTTNPTPTYKLQLASGAGPVYRDVLQTPARDCHPSEVPVIDLARINGNAEERAALAQVIWAAAENTGFFYITNHGIPEEKIAAAHAQAQTFFNQPVEAKARVAHSQSKHFNGWSKRGTARISPTEPRDHKEGFTIAYDPKYDPETKDLAAVPEEIKPWIHGEDFVWEGTSHLPGFKEDVLGYWQAQVQLARRMIRLFALALDVPEDYFDSITSYPGSDGVFNYYPASEPDESGKVDVGIGAHTDIQAFTLLWQDTVGGLQVLTKDGQWLKVQPIPGTFVVNIGDFLMRLSNDRFQSTVHRVYNHATVDRYSMPLFFGFNFNEECSVLPTCCDEDNPPKYEPISCGEWLRRRIKFAYTRT